MADQPDIEVKELAAPESERFGQVVAIAIVVTTLLAALCGYLQAHALLHNDDALARGQQWSAFAARITEQDQQAEQLMVARGHAVQSERLQAAYDVGAARWGGQPTAASSASQLGALAGQTTTDSGRIASGLRAEFASIRQRDSTWLSDPEALRAGDGRGCTPLALASGTEGYAYPYRTSDQRTYYQLDGLRESADTEAAASEKQFTRYAVSLAILAVAVFLLGYSLTPHGRHHRKLYALTAGLMVLGASLWGIYAAVRAPQTASAEAMASYADGRVAFDEHNYGVAAHYFGCAIAQQPNFASAYEWRANAYAGDAVTFSQLSPHALDRITADAETALGLGADDPNLLNNLSASLYVTGVRHRDRDQISQAASLMGRALRSDRNNPVIAMNWAEDQLALGRPWKRALSRAERLDAQTGGVQQMRVDELGALTTLWDSPLGPSLRSSIKAAKQDLAASLLAGHAVAGSSRGNLTPDGVPSLSVSMRSQDGYLEMAPGQAEFLITGGTGFDPVRDRLYAAWYRRSGSLWQSLDGLSGPVEKGTPTGLTVGSPPDQNRLYSLATRSAGTACLGTGEYKVELYVNGTFAGQATDHYSLPESLTDSQLTDMSFSICRPKSWQPLEQGQKGLIDGYASPAKDAGMLVVDASPAAPTRRTPAPPLLHRILQDLEHRYLPPGLNLQASTTGLFAGGLCDGYIEKYAYPGGVLGAGIGRDGYGRELIGIAYGRDFTTTNAMFFSMIADSPDPQCQDAGNS